MDDGQIEEAARRFALLGDPTRLRVFKTVMEKGELPVHSIAAAAGVSRFNASAHLNRLALGRMVTRRREGTTVLYRVADSHLSKVCETMCDTLRLP